MPAQATGAKNHKEYLKEYYQKNKEKIKARSLKRWYALDKKEYQAKRKEREYNWGNERIEAKRTKQAKLAVEKYRANPVFYATLARKNRMKNPERYKKIVRKSILKNTYSLTPEQFEEMAVKQGYACAICARVPNRTLHIDHDHKTGIVRGLLCGNCNTALGLLKDNSEILLQAIKYLN